LPSIAEIESIFKDLKSFSDLLIKIDLDESEKFYRVFRREYGRNPFIQYIGAYTTKLRNESSQFLFNKP
jgi:hypothetical protein